MVVVSNILMSPTGESHITLLLTKHSPNGCLWHWVNPTLLQHITAIHSSLLLVIWLWVNTYRYSLLGDEHPFTSYFDVHQGYQGFDPSPYTCYFSECSTTIIVIIRPSLGAHIKLVSPPFSYGFPMVFLWFSYGFPMVFLWKPPPGADEDRRHRLRLGPAGALGPAKRAGRVPRPHQPESEAILQRTGEKSPAFCFNT